MIITVEDDLDKLAWYVLSKSAWVSFLILLIFTILKTETMDYLSPRRVQVSNYMHDHCSVTDTLHFAQEVQCFYVTPNPLRAVVTCSLKSF